MRRPDAPALARALAWARTAALVLALAGLLLPSPARGMAGGALIVLLVTAPLGRVAWLGWRWWRAGDRRFARSAAALLALVAAGTVLTRLVA
jgi:hypothetical protein